MTAVTPLELPEDVQDQLQNFDTLIGNLKNALGAVAGAVPGPTELAAIPDPMVRARLCLALAKAINALHHVYLRAHGKDPFAPSTAGGAAPGRQELDRLRAYDRKVARAAEEAARRGSRAALSLDVAAASRFIDAAIPDLTQDQKQQLKRAAQAMEAGRGEGPKRNKGGAAGARGHPQAGGGSGQPASQHTPELAEEQAGGGGGGTGRDGAAAGGGGRGSGPEARGGASKANALGRSSGPGRVAAGGGGGGGRGGGTRGKGGMPPAEEAAQRFLAALSEQEDGGTT